MPVTLPSGIIRGETYTVTFLTGGKRTLKNPEEKLNEARDSLSTIIHMIDRRDPEAGPEVLLDLVRAEAVECLDRIREEES